MSKLARKNLRNAQILKVCKCMIIDHAQFPKHILCAYIYRVYFAYFSNLKYTNHFIKNNTYDIFKYMCSSKNKNMISLRFFLFLDQYDNYINYRNLYKRIKSRHHSYFFTI